MYNITELLLLRIWIRKVWVNAYWYLVYLLCTKWTQSIERDLYDIQFVSSSLKCIKGYLWREILQRM